MSEEKETQKILTPIEQECYVLCRTHIKLNFETLNNLCQKYGSETFVKCWNLALHDYNDNQYED